MSLPEPHLTLARPDLADAALEGVLPAARFARTMALRCSRPVAAVRRDPAAGGEQLDQLLFGEIFDVLEASGDWAWGQVRRDGYVGHVERRALAAPRGAPSHRVAALRAYAFAAPDLRSAAVGPLSLNSLVRVGLVRERFVMVEALGWMLAHQLSPIGRVETDVAGVAERFVGAAYLWGGREAQGLDCSGLVQQAMFACGHACPRDADQQQALGGPAPAGGLRRGDLVFWRGHVAIMIDGARSCTPTAFMPPWRSSP